ncbi:hypothetical protein ABIE28_003601 [Devosia sp. 2618]
MTAASFLALAAAKNRKNYYQCAGHYALHSRRQNSGNRFYLPSVLGQVPCRSPPRPSISKPWAPKKSRWPWMRLAVP